MRWLNFLSREIREVVAPVSKEGMEFSDSENCEPGAAASTVIIHGENDAYAEWELDVPKYVRKRLIDMNLRIDTIRTHGMLHCPPDKERSAEIWVNDELLDRIYLVKELPHGTDFGVDSRRPIPVFNYINTKQSQQTIKLWVEEGVFWDVDRVSLEPVIKRREIRTEAAMIIGAIISAIVGALVGCYL